MRFFEISLPSILTVTETLSVLETATPWRPSLSNNSIVALISEGPSISGVTENTTEAPSEDMRVTFGSAGSTVNSGAKMEIRANVVISLADTVTVSRVFPGRSSGTLSSGLIHTVR